MNSNCLLLLNGLKGHFGLERLAEGGFVPQNVDNKDIYIDFHLYNPAVKTHLSTDAYNNPRYNNVHFHYPQDYSTLQGDLISQSFSGIPN